MIDPQTSHRWVFRLLFLAMALIILFLRLLPLQTTPSGWAGPDYLFCLTAAWILRRPDQIPALSVVIAFLFADIYYQYPPGLMTVFAVVATEFFRSRSPFMREYPFAVEWLVFAVVTLIMFIAYRFALVAFTLPVPQLWLDFTRILSTVAAYPVMVAMLYWALGIGRSGPTQRERQPT